MAKTHIIPFYLHGGELYKNNWSLCMDNNNSTDYVLIKKGSKIPKAVIVIKRTSKECFRIVSADLVRNRVKYQSASTAHKAAVKINKIIKEINEMKGDAIYLGYRETQTKKRVDENTGEVFPAVKAKSHTFFQNEWNEDGAIQEQGMFFNQFVKATDDEQPEFIVGKIYHINVTDMTKRSCVVIGEKE